MCAAEARAAPIRSASSEPHAADDVVVERGVGVSVEHHPGSNAGSLADGVVTLRTRAASGARVSVLSSNVLASLVATSDQQGIPRGWRLL